MLRTIARTLAWTGLIAILAATISPISERPHSIFSPSVERAGAFFALGLLFYFGYPKRLPFVVILTLFAAGGFEAAQLLTIDRHATIDGAVVKAFGGTVGIAFGYLCGLFLV